jgi:aminoglycoside phosphotransferase (APT) family kinase protein
VLDDRSDVDVAALHAVLARELGVDVTDVSVLADGLNLLLSVSTADRDDALVLRAPRKLRDASYMTDLRSEYAVMQALWASPVPVPEPVCFCEDESVLDAPFVAMPRVDGEVVPLGSDLPERFRSPAARERFAHEVVDALAAIHDVDPDAVADAVDRVGLDEHVRRSRARLDAALEATDLAVPSLERVGDWLREHAPADHEYALVHGDYRPGNVLFAPGDEPRVAAVLDWETAMVGDPLTELGYLLLRWRDPGDPTPDVDAIAARYPDATDAIAHLERANEHGFAPYTSKPGSPTRRELVARYEAATGREFAAPQFYVALAAFDLATVWSDLHRHAVESGASSDWPPHIAHLAAVAELVVDGDLVA